MIITDILGGISGKSPTWIVRNLCEDKIGEGVYRDVYSIKENVHFVIKIERDPSQTQFTNACEWRNFIESRYDSTILPWLAPCHSISETSQVLIQRRVRHHPKRPFPLYVPRIFMDIKKENFGWIGQRFVCCDYPWFVNNTQGMKKAYWDGDFEQMVNLLQKRRK